MNRVELEGIFKPDSDGEYFFLWSDYEGDIPEGPYLTQERCEQAAEAWIELHGGSWTVTIAHFIKEISG